MAEYYSTDFNEILEEERQKLEETKTARKSAVVSMYYGRISELNEQYDKAIDDTNADYSWLKDRNTVQRLITERQIKETLTKMNAKNSDLNRTQRTATQISHTNRNSDIDRARRNVVDRLSMDLATSVSWVEQNKENTLDELEAFSEQEVQNNAIIHYNANLQENKRIYEEELRQYEEGIKAAAADIEKSKYIVSSSTGTLNRAYVGSLKSNGVDTVYNYQADGTLKSVTYNDNNSGISATFAAGVNPYCGYMHEDAKDKNGVYDPSKVYSNGYQPNNIGGKKLVLEQKKGFSINGNTQNVFKCGDKYYVWDGANNEYFEVKRFVDLDEEQCYWYLASNDKSRNIAQLSTIFNTDAAFRKIVDERKKELNAAMRNSSNRNDTDTYNQQKAELQFWDSINSIEDYKAQLEAETYKSGYIGKTWKEIDVAKTDLGSQLRNYSEKGDTANYDLTKRKIDALNNITEGFTNPKEYDNALKINEIYNMYLNENTQDDILGEVLRAKHRYEESEKTLEFIKSESKKYPQYTEDTDEYIEFVKEWYRKTGTTDGAREAYGYKKGYVDEGAKYDRKREKNTMMLDFADTLLYYEIKYGSKDNIDKLADMMSQHSFVNSVNEQFLKFYTEMQEDPNALKYIEKGKKIYKDKNPNVLDKEREVAYYYLGKGQKENSYFDWLKDVVYEREVAAKSGWSSLNEGGAVKYHTLWSDYVKAAPIEASLMSVGLNLAAGTEFVYNTLTGNVNESKLSKASAKIREAQSNKHNWEIAGWDAYDFLYNGLMSGVDSLAASAFGSKGGAAILAASAAASGVNDALERGMSDSQAFWNGLAAGTFEYIFEKYSLDQLDELKASNGAEIKTILKNLTKTMLQNSEEETATEIANIAYDFIFNGDLSNIAISYNKYIDNGFSKEEAIVRILGDVGLQVGEAGASGALIGLGFGTIGTSSAAIKATKYGKYYYGFSQKSVNALVENGLAMPEGSNAFNQAAKAQSRLDSGKKLSGTALYNLATAIEGEIQTKSEARLSELGENKGNIKEVSAAVAKKVFSGRLTSAEVDVINNSEYGNQVVEELSADSANTIWKDTIKSSNGNNLNLTTKNNAAEGVGVNADGGISKVADGDKGNKLVHSKGNANQTADLQASEKHSVSYDTQSASVDNALELNVVNSAEQLEKTRKSGTINHKYVFNSQGDPLVEVTGDAETSNPKELEKFKEELKLLGVELKQKEVESLGYAPGLTSGQPGTVYISRGASYGAWCHEMQHVRDDSSAGWTGMRILMDKNEHYMREIRAYQLEIDIAEKFDRPDIIDRLKENLENERIKIYGK